MSSLTRMILAKDVWQPIADLLHIDTKGMRKMSVTLEVGDVVRVETEGYACKRPECPVIASPDGMRTVSNEERMTQQRASGDATGGEMTFEQAGESV